MKITVIMGSTTVTRDFGDGDEQPGALELCEFIADCIPVLIGWNKDKIVEAIEFLEQERDENMKEYLTPLPRSMGELDERERP